MSDFYPISPLVAITNTSYGAQAGVMDEMWACRVVRSKKILAEKTMSELSLENFVGVIYGHVRVEGLSRHAVAQCAGRLMQFSRRYQTSGVAPNFEIPDLVRDDGESLVPVSGTSDTGATGIADPVGESAEQELQFTPVGHLPSFSPLAEKEIWGPIIESHGTMLCELAAYGSQLSEEHLRTMFERVATELLRRWVEPGNPLAVVTKFGELILSCSTESQIPKTGTQNVTVETQNCRLLTIARENDPEVEKIPHGYPCKFHEILATKVSEVTGLIIGVNTSSTGCIITMSFE